RSWRPWPIAGDYNRRESVRRTGVRIRSSHSQNQLTAKNAMDTKETKIDRKDRRERREKAEKN
ncbi:MAG TPA: hypothetical protein VG759_23585, partial [Candidatus Angelobacter sp.]|nr:hypothetical protein [Candidatus Angelobacter sp.]